MESTVIYPWYPIKGLYEFHWNTSLSDSDITFPDRMPRVVLDGGSAKCTIILRKTKLLYESGLEEEVQYQEIIELPREVIGQMLAMNGGRVLVRDEEDTDDDYARCLQNWINAAVSMILNRCLNRPIHITHNSWVERDDGFKDPFGWQSKR